MPGEVIDYESTNKENMRQCTEDAAKELVKSYGRKLSVVLLDNVKLSATEKLLQHSFSVTILEKDSLEYYSKLFMKKDKIRADTSWQEKVRIIHSDINRYASYGVRHDIAWLDYNGSWTKRVDGAVRSFFHSITPGGYLFVTFAVRAHNDMSEMSGGILHSEAEARERIMQMIGNSHRTFSFLEFRENTLYKAKKTEMINLGLKFSAGE